MELIQVCLRLNIMEFFRFNFSHVGNVVPIVMSIIIYKDGIGVFIYGVSMMLNCTISNH